MRLFICIIILILYPGPDLNAIIPSGRPDNELFYKTRRELYLRGCLEPAVSLFAPAMMNKEYSSDDFPDLPGLRSIYFNYLDRFEISPERFDFNLIIISHGYLNDDRQKIYPAMIPEIRAGVAGNLSIELAYRVDCGLVDDPLYTGKKWENVAGYAELATLSYTKNNLSISLGRRRNSWGTANHGNSLMLASASMPMDGIFIDYAPGRFLSFHSITAWLSTISERPQYATAEPSENRYFSAHAVRISPFSWCDFILKESIVYGGVGRRLEPAYVMPFLWYHAEQLNSSIDDNTFLGLESIVRISKKCAGYFEILVDDLQIEKKYESDNEPAETGLIAGIDIFDFPASTSALELEYTRIANHTYNQIKPRNIYIHLGYPIGNPEGPDHESLNLNYTYHFSKNFLAELSLYLTRRGEGRLGDEWSSPWEDNPGYREKFPSGVVEKARGGSLAAYFHKNALFQSKLLFKVADINNDDNIPGKDITSWEIGFEIIYNFPKLSWRVGDG
jgi:hypothetical protein